MRSGEKTKILWPFSIRYWLKCGFYMQISFSYCHLASDSHKMPIFTIYFFKQAKPQNLLLWIIFKSPNVEMAISYTTMELAAACMKRFLEIVIKNWHETQFFLHIYMYQINLNLQKTAIPLKYRVFETPGPNWVPSGHLKGCFMAGNIF